MYENYAKIRDQLGYKDSYVAAQANIRKSVLSDWKSGRYLPKIDKLEKIAQVLGVSASAFYDDQPQEDKYYISPAQAEMAQQIFENKELRLLFDAAKDADPEDLRTVHQMLLALKRKENGND